MHVLSIYRPPSYSEHENLTLLNFLYDFCTGKELLILGDLNLSSVQLYVGSIAFATALPDVFFCLGLIVVIIIIFSLSVFSHCLGLISLFSLAGSFFCFHCFCFHWLCLFTFCTVFTGCLFHCLLSLSSSFLLFSKMYVMFLSCPQ